MRDEHEWAWEKVSTIISAVVDEGIRPEIEKEMPEAYRNLIERCWSADPNERPTFDEIDEELKTNEGFITEKIDANMSDLLMKQTKQFKVDKKASLIDEIVKRKTHVFCQSDFDPSKRGPLKRDDDFTLKDYELKTLDTNDDLFKVGEIEHKETKVKFKVLLCLTEISNFTRNEIIEFTQKVNITAQLNHPSIQKFVNFSPVDFENLLKPAVIEELLNSTLECVNGHHRRMKRCVEVGFDIESIPDDKSLWNDTKRLIKYIWNCS